MNENNVTARTYNNEHSLKRLYDYMDRNQDIAEQSMKNQEAQYRSRLENDALLRKMLEREIGDREKLGTGNPFIDMLDGYIGMRKRNNENYEWEGIVPKAGRAIGGLLGLAGYKSASTPVQPEVINNNVALLDQTPRRMPDIYNAADRTYLPYYSDDTVSRYVSPPQDMELLHANAPQTESAIPIEIDMPSLLNQAIATGNVNKVPQMPTYGTGNASKMPLPITQALENGKSTVGKRSADYGGAIDSLVNMFNVNTDQLVDRYKRPNLLGGADAQLSSYSGVGAKPDAFTAGLNYGKPATVPSPRRPRSNEIKNMIKATFGR